MTRRFMMTSSSLGVRGYGIISKMNARLTNRQRWLWSFAVGLSLTASWMLVDLNDGGGAIGGGEPGRISLFVVMVGTLLAFFAKGVVFHGAKRLRCPLCRAFMFHEHDMFNHLEWHAVRDGHPVTVTMTVHDPGTKRPPRYGATTGVRP